VNPNTPYYNTTCKGWAGCDFVGSRKLSLGSGFCLLDTKEHLIQSKSKEA
jgi:hypothetical protein